MKITTSAYSDFKINRNGPLFTRDTSLLLRGGGWKGADRNIGGCDHFMKSSIKSIVNHYERRILKEGFPGKHVVTIKYAEGVIAGPNDEPKTMRVILTAS